jgi:hypothetical protein
MATMRVFTRETSVSPTLLTISSLLYTREEHNAMYFPIQITSDTESEMEIVEGLLDSGASGEFIDQDYARNIHAIKKIFLTQYRSTTWMEHRIKKGRSHNMLI